MNLKDIEVLAEAVAPVIRAYVDQATAPHLAKIEEQAAEIAAMKAAKAKAAERTEALIADLNEQTKQALERLDASLEKMRVTFDGRIEEQRAKLATDEEFLQRMAEEGKSMFGAAFEMARKEAAPGLRGEKGDPGADGKDADMDALKAHCEALVAEAVAAIPVPENGKDGRDGIDGKDGAPGEKGADGKDGADGVGLAGAMIDRDGNLNLTLTNGEVKSLGLIVGRDGKDGERGPDGFSLKNFDTEFRPEDKVVVFKFEAGDTAEFHEMFLPYVRDCGVWAEGKTYLEGDGVTWGGSFWIAQADTDDKPETSKAWRLAVKRGRDGKDFHGPVEKGPVKVKV